MAPPSCTQRIRGIRRAQLVTAPMETPTPSLAVDASEAQQCGVSSDGYVMRSALPPACAGRCRDTPSPIKRRLGDVLPCAHREEGGATGDPGGQRTIHEVALPR